MPFLRNISQKLNLYRFRRYDVLKNSIYCIENNHVSRFSSPIHGLTQLFNYNNRALNIFNISNRRVFSTLNTSQFLLESSLAKTGFETKVGWWLMGCSGLTLFIMGFGAYVRLNESGLSMVDWRFLGLPLPKDEVAWRLEFNKYKKTPEYKKVHSNIDLEDYKNIFMKEWLHRMIGRASGAFFALGAAYFSLTRALKPAGYALLLGIGSVGVFQAFVGKWMVESGFFEPKTENKTPRVSPYRLCFHFLNAIAIYSLCFYNGLNLLLGNVLSVTSRPDLKRVKLLSRATAGLALLTIAYGTFMAGNDSGLAYNTWPLMDGRYFPPELFKPKGWRQFFENDALIQFNHRNLAYLTTLSSLALLLVARRGNVNRSVKKMSMGVLHASLLQGVLGVVTLLYQVPLHGALAHHFNAVALWSAILALLRVVK